MIITREKYLDNITTLLVYSKFMLDFDPNTPNVQSFVSLINRMKDRYSLDLISLDELVIWFTDLSKAVQYFTTKYPPRKSLPVISGAINDLLVKDSQELKDHGIQVSWLKDLMDIENYLTIHDLPNQTYINIGDKKGLWKNDEYMLLKDAFSLLVKTQISFKLFEETGKKIQEQKKNDARLHLLYFDASCFGRTTVLSFYAFFECFVNSMGYSFYLENKDVLKPESINILHGNLKDGSKKKNGEKRKSTIKNKIKDFQKVMREDKSIVINVTDTGQIQEPFKSIFEKYTYLRDSTMHNSPSKMDIWMSSYQWLTNAEEFGKLVLEASSILWKTLVNESTGPKYLMDLDFDILLKEAEDAEIQKVELLNEYFKLMPS